ncbi:hypothetical protein GRI39_02175 [Altererythrobacter indicus]|uniref:Uncharacterized protein n=1 Tax=Altericroceibacterium indicum TaxID=374177 RepID=A0A845A544_9SPHN|nr:hypothetical protein [Altericroceibacterium indicum]MXP24854.1 hypothetical protein [Altericroceibacterium indicum]
MAMGDQIEELQLSDTLIKAPEPPADVVETAVERMWWILGTDLTVEEAKQGNDASYAWMADLARAAIEAAEPHITARVQKAREEEREACAKVAENWPDRIEGSGIAYSIRNREGGE